MYEKNKQLLFKLMRILNHLEPIINLFLNSLMEVTSYCETEIMFRVTTHHMSDLSDESGKSAKSSISEYKLCIYTIINTSK